MINDYRSEQKLEFADFKELVLMLDYIIDTALDVKQKLL